MKELTLELTSRCQLTCPWCSSYRDTPIDMNFEDVINHLDLAHGEGFSSVRFSGGEPTLHEYITPIIKHARTLGFNITLLTNGMNRYFNMGIDKYEIQWQIFNVHIIKWYNNMCKADNNMSINVVNVTEAHIGPAINFAGRFDIPIHIMKLQDSGAARLNKKILHEVHISITGDSGCNYNNKKLIRPDNTILHCSADKTNNTCKYCKEQL